MTKISFGYNAVPEEARERVLAVFMSGRYSPGGMVREFEEEFARVHQAKHAVFVNSGTDALRLSLLALKEQRSWPDGARVAVPALTFVATVNVILQCGLRPFFVDVGMNDYLMNGENLAWRLKTGQDDLVAVMPVHLFGAACEDRVYQLAAERGWAVLEDSCETILNVPRGEVSCHSTYMAHHLTTGVGGMVVTHDTDLNYLVRSYANHGRSTDYLPGYFSKSLSKDLLKARFRFDRMGYSCRGTEFEAALGLSQMDGLVENLARRRAVAQCLIEVLGGFKELVLPTHGRPNTWMMFPVVLSERSRMDKYDLCLHLEQDGIETRDMMPITNQPCFRGLMEEDHFTVAQWINRNGFYIPCHPKVEVQRIFESFDSFFKRQTLTTGGIGVITSAVPGKAQAISDLPFRAIGVKDSEEQLHVDFEAREP